MAAVKSKIPAKGWVIFAFGNDPGLQRFVEFCWTNKWGRRVALEKMASDLTERYNFFPADLVVADDERGRRILDDYKKLPGAIAYDLENGFVSKG